MLRISYENVLKMGVHLVADVYIKISCAISSCLVALSHIFIVNVSQVAENG